jgi:hypothetical protein
MNKYTKAIPVQVWIDPLRLQEVDAPRISRHEGGKAGSPTHWPHLPTKEVLLVFITVTA